MHWLPNPPAGESICLGFDGSENNDWTAIKAESRAGMIFTPRYGPDRRPTIWNPAEWGGKVPRDEVRVAVSEIFESWKVERMYCDPQDWRSEIGDWALEHGEEHVFEWPTNQYKRMYAALSRFDIDLSTGRITHDGCPLTATAVANAKKIAKPGQTYILGKPTDHQKIDPAMAMVLAHEAAMDARAKGWDIEEDNSVIVLGRRRR
ncbi:terminase TerL endonuclease subunit [Corynebacterium sp. H127]|uniref:terminase TerL endonuclease subunit n=1 Tax=Corynebacterium sp. H127 TaxID=3133418 RepID=UPI00309FDDC2